MFREETQGPRRRVARGERRLGGGDSHQARRQLRGHRREAAYRSTGSEGTVTLSQEGGKDVLTFMVADRRGSARLERVK